MRGRRIFLAIDISHAAREVCARHVEELRSRFPDTRVGWERPEKMHVTLKFLGDTTEEKLEILEEEIVKTAIGHPAFQATLTRPDVFPNRSKPRILWIGLADPENRFAAVHASIDGICKRLGYENERRSYTPHVTIGRIREPQNAATLADAHLTMRIESIRFDVTEIVIYESKLGSSGSVYTPLASFPLAPGSAAVPPQ